VTLRGSALRIASEFPSLSVHAVVGDFERHVPLLPRGGRGSSPSSEAPSEISRRPRGRRFLEDHRGQLGPADGVPARDGSGEGHPAPGGCVQRRAGRDGGVQQERSLGAERRAGSRLRPRPVRAPGALRRPAGVDRDASAVDRAADGHGPRPGSCGSSSARAS
jgi:hypothetical protein